MRAGTEVYDPIAEGASHQNLDNFESSRPATDSDSANVTFSSALDPAMGTPSLVSQMRSTSISRNNEAEAKSDN